MVQNNLPGEQTMQWEKKNKEAYIIQSANFKADSNSWIVAIF